MKRILLSALLLASVIMTFAAPVPKEKTHAIAMAFFRERGGNDSLVEVQTQFSHLRIYAASKGKGFVIMSSDDAAIPVLAYSVNNPFSAEGMPDNVAYWLGNYDSQIAHIQEDNLEADDEIRDEWRYADMMRYGARRRLPSQTKRNVANLLSTTWAQGTYYNSQCPGSSTHALTGCVATAMGQIMRYWGFPQNGVGSHSYTDRNYGTQSADFSTANYDFSNMPSSLNGSSTGTQVNAVAKLLYHCGVAVEMEYDTNGSAASTVGSSEVGYAAAENAYREYFKFMHTLHAESMENYTLAEWKALLKSEIDSGRPMQYSARDLTDGGGHSFICCGYDNTGKFYFNWGWGGTDDAYYTIGALNPSGSQYQGVNRAIVGIRPDNSGASTTVINLQRNIQNAGSESGAGTYTSYQSTVEIRADANTGYVFQNWDGGMHYNPYQFIANGGNVTHTAYYSLLKGDTLGYCLNENVSAYGNSTPKQYFWGIRLDSMSLTKNRLLKQVMFYCDDTAQYKIHIYKGGRKAPEEELLINTLNCPYSGQWVVATLSTPISVDATKSLWIVLECSTVSYPMVYSEYRGNPDGAWKTSDATSKSWTNYVNDYQIYVSWQIRGIFAENLGPYVIEVTANNDQWGSVTGSGTYSKGASVTISATANAGYEFVRWSDGESASSRTFTVDCDGWYEAVFQKIGSGVESVESEGYLVAAESGVIEVKGAENQVVKIFDAQGKLMVEGVAESSIEQFDISSGIYFVRINAHTYKIVVE